MQQFQAEKNIQEGEISIKEIAHKLQQWFRFLLGKWKIITAFAFIGAVLGIVYSYINPTIYKAQLTFVLENSGKPAGGYSSLASQFGLNVGGSGGMFSEDDNLMALMRSRAMVTRTLLSDAGDGQELLIDHYINFNNLRSRWKSNNRLANLSFSNGEQANTRTHDSILGVIYKTIVSQNLAIDKPDKKVDIISVTTSATDEWFAKSFTEKLLENVSRFYIETQTKKSQDNVNILRYQVDSVRKLLNSALTEVAVSADANPNVNPGLQRLKVPSQKRMVDVEMNKAILQELVKNLELSEISLRKETPLVQVIDRPILPLERKRIGKLKGFVFGLFLGGLISAAFLSLRLYVRAILR